MTRTATASGGSITYTPRTGYAGTDSFRYRVTDGTLQSEWATVTVTVIDGPPVAGDDSVSTPKNTPVTVSVLGNDSDPDGDLISISSVGRPSNGTATASGGSITYTPRTHRPGIVIPAGAQAP